MEINLSFETIETACIALNDAKRSLKKQLKNESASETKKEVLRHQLEEVENALSTFEELLADSEGETASARLNKQIEIVTLDTTREGIQKAICEATCKNFITLDEVDQAIESGEIVIDGNRITIQDVKSK